MVPKVEGPWDIHYVDRLLAQLEAKAGLDRPILVHAILETGLGVVNLEEIATASPRMQGMSFGPADLAASRRMKTTRVGGGHPGYRVINDPDPEHPEAPRPTAQQDPWHYSIARMVDACTSAGILPFYGPFGDIRDVEGCETQFRAAFLLGCVGAWSLHPVQIEIAKKVFSPDPDEVLFAKKVLEAIPDGRGVHMIDGKMQDDATWKQCKVMVDARRDARPQGPRARRRLRVRAPWRAPRRLRACGSRPRPTTPCARRSSSPPPSARSRSRPSGSPPPRTSRSTSSRTSSASCATPGSSAATAAPRAASGWPSPPTQVTIADVIRAVEGPLASVRGGPPEEASYAGAAAAAAARLDRGPREPAPGGRARHGRRRRQRHSCPPAIDKLAEDPEAWVTR